MAICVCFTFIFNFDVRVDVVAIRSISCRNLRSHCPKTVLDQESGNIKSSSSFKSGRFRAKIIQDCRTLISVAGRAGDGEAQGVATWRD
jgi:hypothetical protein